MKPVSRNDAGAPFVLAIDMGSSSVRALLFDRTGRQVDASETQFSHVLRTSSDGASEADAVPLFDLVCACVDGTLDRAGDRSSDIGGVAASSFWHGLLGLDDHDEPTTPVFMWSDKRSGHDVATLRQRIDPELLHRETGCRPHSSYWPAKLLWLKRTQPDVWERTRHWLSFCDFVALRLQGERFTSFSMASGTGLLNAGRLEWHTEALDAITAGLASMPALVDRDTPAPRLRPDFQRRWPALADVPWFPAIGDGAAANVGAGCVGDNRIAITVGTSAAMRVVVDQRMSSIELPERLWCYLLDRDRKVLGGALSNGGNVTGWLIDLLSQGSFEEITEQAGTLAPDGHGLTFLPFLAGERSPSWNDDATGTIAGIRLSTTPVDIFRAALEATAYRIAAIHDDLRSLVSDPYEIDANGSAALNSPLWLQIIADTLGHQVDAVDAETEASAQGAAICALQALGELPDLESMARKTTRSFQPVSSAHAVYAAARKRQSALETAIYPSVGPALKAGATNVLL